MPDDRTIEEAHEVTDLINLNSFTKKLTNRFLKLIEFEMSVELAAMGSRGRSGIYDAEGSLIGMRPETVEERHSRLDQTSARVEGLRWLPERIQQFREIAREDDERKAQQKAGLKEEGK